MEPILFISLILGFFTTLFILPRWIKRAERFGLAGKDMNKYNGRKIAEAGGVAVLTGFILGVLFYIAINTFYFKSTDNTIEIFALLTSILILGFIGITDGLLGWKIGLRRRVRLILVLFAAIPLMVINAGNHSMSFQLLNGNLSWIYSLIIIPIGIVGATATFNFLAGFNGLEAGQGAIILTALSLVAFLTGSSWLALIGLIMVVCLFAFLIFNLYPAKVFPGDVITYPIGGLIAIIAILGNFEKIAVFFFIPYILETILKSRGKLVKQSFGKPKKDGSLDLPYNKIYGIEHAAILMLQAAGFKATEKRVVYLIWSFQIFIIIAGLIIFRKGIF